MLNEVLNRLKEIIESSDSFVLSRYCIRKGHIAFLGSIIDNKGFCELRIDEEDINFSFGARKEKNLTKNTNRRL